jgi:hypothetical protein
MKKKMLAALATCLVSMTDVVAAEQSTEATTAPPGVSSPAGVAPPAAAVPATPIPTGPKTIVVDAGAQARFGLTFATLKGMAAPTDAATTARVLDPASLLQLDGVLATAAAGFTASRTEALRVRKAYSEDRIGTYRDVQAANAQAGAELERVNAARRELALRWGGGVADMQAHRRAELMADLTNAHAELVRVEIPAGMPIPRAGSNLTVHGSSAGEVFSGEVLGGLPPTADPGGSQTRAVLVELKADAAKLPVGQTLSAEVPNPDVEGADGVILPRSALLRRDARAWVYVQTAPTEFIRREVHGPRSVTSGWFVAQGFAPGDRVVALGAPALLGIESPAPAGTDTN